LNRYGTNAVRKFFRFKAFVDVSHALTRLFERLMQGVMHAMPVVQVHNKKEAQ
jgi:microsomal dipeptidase-like Zn-dependent dipeptidase